LYLKAEALPDGRDDVREVEVSHENQTRLEDLTAGRPDLEFELGGVPEALRRRARVLGIEDGGQDSSV